MNDDTRNRLFAATLVIALLLVVASIWWFFKPASHRLVSINPAQQKPQAPPAVPATNALTWNPAQQGGSVTCAAFDQRGDLWVGTEDHGVWRYPAPSGPWTRFTSGDESVCAIAVDTRNRVWVGHERGGVEVYNGEKWLNYDATRGPLGERVCRIAVSPSGDVWLASDVGLARYRDKSDAWSYYTRADGLSSDQPTSLSFERDGSLWVGTRCDGIAVAQPADDYKVWRHLAGAVDASLLPTGKGLPSNVINDVLVARDGSIFAATSRGLARSSNGGNSFTFFRGVDWIEKAKQSIDGPPASFQPTPGAFLAQDFVTCLAEGEPGKLWVGFRNHGFQQIDVATMKVVSSGGAGYADYCATIVPQPDGGTPFIGTRGAGLTRAGKNGGATFAKSSVAPAIAPLPTPATASSAEELAAMRSRVTALSGEAKPAYLRDDWTTQGDWVGRYGRQQSVWPYYGRFNSANDAYAVSLSVGPHQNGRAHVYTWYGDLDSKSQLVLYAPGRGRRLLGEWNDGGWQQFGPDFEGADLWLDLTLPEGVYRFSMYFNGAPVQGPIRGRDLLLEVKDFEPIELAQHAPTLARGRSLAMAHPHFNTFVLPGGHYWVRIATSYSEMASLAATFIDRVDGPIPAADDSTRHYLKMDYDPPTVPPAAGDSAQLTAARALWSALDAAWVHDGAARYEVPYRLQAYRAALASGAPDKLLENWRWHLLLWTVNDRASWNAAMKTSRATTKAAAATQAAQTKPTMQ